MNNNKELEITNNRQYHEIRHDLEQLKAGGWITNFMMYRDNGKSYLTIVHLDGTTKRMSQINTIRMALTGFKQGIMASHIRQTIINDQLRNLIDEINN